MEDQDVPPRVVSGEITIHQATELSKSSIAPAFFHGNPANVLYGMQLARSLGVDPVAALRHIHVFETEDKNGEKKTQTALSADLMVTLARNAGHVVHVTSNEARAIGTLIRGDHFLGKMAKGEVTAEQLKVITETISTLKDLGIDAKELGFFQVRWTQERAHEIGLMSKRNWKNYTTEMLAARAKSSVVRLGASEVTLGIPYTPDELGFDEEDGIPLITTLGRIDADPVASNGSSPMQQAHPNASTQQNGELSEADKLAMAYVKSTASNLIADQAKQIVEDPELGREDKAYRVIALHKACRALSRLSDEIDHDGGTASIDHVLLEHIRSLAPAS